MFSRFLSSGLYFFFSASLWAEEVLSKESFLKKYVLDGGATMFLILVAVLVLLGLATFQFLSLRQKLFVNPALKSDLWDLLGQCRLHSAIGRCEEELQDGKESVLAQVLKMALPKVDGTNIDTLGRAELEEVVANELAIQQEKRMFWLRQISLVAQTAPMLGLLGTVIGIVNAFATLSVTGQADPSQLSGDISVALLTTMWGLITAILALLAYSFFNQRLNKCLHLVENTVAEGFDLFEKQVKGEGLLAKVPEGMG